MLNHRSIRLGNFDTVFGLLWHREPSCTSDYDLCTDNQLFGNPRSQLLLCHAHRKINRQCKCRTGQDIFCSHLLLPCPHDRFADIHLQTLRIQNHRAFHKRRTFGPKNTFRILHPNNLLHTRRHSHNHERCHPWSRPYQRNNDLPHCIPIIWANILNNLPCILDETDSWADWNLDRILHFKYPNPFLIPIHNISMELA